jgi:hypothetical protein
VTREVCLFLHLPKTAGTTLKACLYDEYAVASDEGDTWFRDGIYYFPYGFHKARRPRFTRRVRAALAHDDLRAVTGHFWFGLHRHVPRPSVYVTLLRDPVERVVSLYHHVLKVEGELLHEEVVARGASLAEFVAGFGCREVDNDQTRRIAGVEPPFGEVDGAVLAQAQRNLREFAFVGVTERFDESLVALRRRLGWEYVLYLPALVNRERPAVSSLPPETVAAVAARNEHDAALYEYANRLLDAEVAAGGESFARELDELRRRNAEHVARYAHVVAY